MFGCDIAHSRSVAVYYTCCIRSGVIRCTLIFRALHAPYVPVRVTRGALVAHRYTYTVYASSLQNPAVSNNFFFASVSLWNDLADPVFDGV